MKVMTDAALVHSDPVKRFVTNGVIVLGRLQWAVFLLNRRRHVKKAFDDSISTNEFAFLGYHFYCKQVLLSLLILSLLSPLATVQHFSDISCFWVC